MNMNTVENLKAQANCTINAVQNGDEYAEAGEWAEVVLEFINEIEEGRLVFTVKEPKNALPF